MAAGSFIQISSRYIKYKKEIVKPIYIVGK